MNQRGRPILASYRLQLTPAFGFAQVVDLLDVIAGLGVSHLYLSPISEAVSGSEHGYDVVDHRAVRSEFGGEAGLVALLDAAAAHDLGVVIDHVPNHVSVARAELNPHWWALLRDGPDGAAASWFDIDWESTDGKVIVPCLGEPLEDVLAAGGLVVADTDRGPELHYGPLRFPIASGDDPFEARDLELPELLARQHYQLTWWRDPARNVRRFFTIDDLVAVRVEDEAVQSVVDSIPRRLSEHPAFSGVRVDHVDGLADPLGYLLQLRATIGDDRWLLVEKILGPGESLPLDWPVDGTTGYEHITVSEHTMIDDRSLPPLDAFWRTCAAPGTAEFDAVEDRSRREALTQGLLPDLDRLVRSALAQLDPALDPHAADIGDDRSPPGDPRTDGPPRPLSHVSSRRCSVACRPGRPGGAHGGGVTRPRSDRAVVRSPGPALRRRPNPLAAALRSGDGQGRRGSRVLSPSTIVVALRSRWAAGALVVRHRRVPSSSAVGAGRLADDHVGRDDARHEALVGGAGAVARADR